MNERERIGKKIIEERKKLRITQDELAIKAGILRPNLSRIENGKYNVGFDILQRIAEVLGKNIDIV